MWAPLKIKFHLCGLRACFVRSAVKKTTENAEEAQRPLSLNN